MSTTHMHHSQTGAIRHPLDGSSSGEEYAILTPASSTNQEARPSTYAAAVPQPSETYRIHLRGTDRVLTVVEGELRLQAPGGGGGGGGPGGGWFWTCVERDGWLGFRNHVSGTYLGRDARGALHARAVRHAAWEDCCPRADPRGGYALLFRHGWADQLWAAACGGDGGLVLVPGKGEEGAQWEFEKV